jgi:NADPH:quinone reductase
MKMKAVVKSGYGGPEVLQLVDVDRPEIDHPHDVLVRVHAAGVNYSDIHTRRAAFDGYETLRARVDNARDGPPFRDEIGQVPGLDGAGVVEAVGPAVTRFATGESVYYVDGGFGPRAGNYAQFKIVDEHYLAPKPASMDFGTAAAIPTALVTAWESLYDRVHVKPGQFIVVHGGAGAVGHFGVQLARRQGARVAATVSSAEKGDLVTELGAERVIRYRNEDVVTAIRQWSGKPGADVVFDTVGGQTFLDCFDQVATYGTLLSVTMSPWPTGLNSVPQFMNLSIVLENMGLPQVARDHAARCRQTEILSEAATLFDEHALKVIVGARYPLADAREAHRALESGTVTGRVVLEVPA